MESYQQGRQSNWDKEAVRTKIVLRDKSWAWFNVTCGYHVIQNNANTKNYQPNWKRSEILIVQQKRYYNVQQNSESHFSPLFVSTSWKSNSRRRESKVLPPPLKNCRRRRITIVLHNLVNVDLLEYNKTNSLRFNYTLDGIQRPQ